MNNFGSGSDAAAGMALLGLGLGILALIVLFILAIQVLICFLLHKCYQRIPQPFRKMEAGLVWLLLIPCFNLIWNFFVYP